MHMRITHGHIDPDRIDEYLDHVDPDLTAAVTGLPGCQSYVTGMDRASGRLATVSTWDTRDHAGWPRGALGDLVPRLVLLSVRLDPPEIIEAARAWTPGSPGPPFSEAQARRP
jgi:hypothetical protein